MSRKVSVYIYQYPEDANRTMSLRRFMDLALSEEKIWHDTFFSSHDLRDLLNEYKHKLIDYSALIGEPHVYRIVVRDSFSRLIASFRI